MRKLLLASAMLGGVFLMAGGPADAATAQRGYQAHSPAAVQHVDYNWHHHRWHHRRWHHGRWHYW